MKYEVTFSWEVTRQETCKALVEANSEEEAIELAKNENYLEVEIEGYVTDYKDFTLENIETIDED